MKKGKIIVLLAISMSVTTLIWGLFKRLPNAESLSDNTTKATEITANSVFYPSKNMVYSRINAPLDVVLDPTFAGIKVEGDSSLFKYLDIYVDNSLNAYGMNVQSEKGSNIGDLQVIVGTKGNLGHPYVQYTFRNCATVRTSEKLNFENVRFDISNVASVELDFDALQMSTWMTGSDSQPAQVTFNGTCRRAFIHDAKYVDVDFEKFIVEEAYVSDVQNADLKIYASDIANFSRLCSTTYSTFGNPNHVIERSIDAFTCR